MRARSTLTGLVVAGLLTAGAASAIAGTPPHRADKELGTVLKKPKIYNLLWDGNWNLHNAAAIKKGNIHTFMRTLVGARKWTAGAAQYGVKSFSFGGTVDASPKCGPRRAPTKVSSARVFLWATCMVGKGGVAGPHVRVPVSNDLYVVYLPERTTITDNITIPALHLFGKTYGPWTLVNSSSCPPGGGYSAYHAFSTYYGQLFPIVIAPTKCFNSSLDGLTEAVSHEVIEASTNPLLALGWIDTSLPLFTPRYTEGEVADICEPGTGAVGTKAVTHGGFSFATYWSNKRGTCVG